MQRKLWGMGYKAATGGSSLLEAWKPALMRPAA